MSKFLSALSRFKKSLFSLLIIGLLPGCSQLNALAVDDNENAFACVKGNTGVPFLGGSGVMVDVGKTDTTTWVAADWESLAEICD